MLDKIVECCHYLLNNFSGAQDSKLYLNSRLTEESQKKFQFGYFPNMENLPVLVDLVGEEYLHQAELLYTRQIEDCLFPRKILSSYFEDYPLIMPFRNPYGQPAGLVGRCLLSEPEQKKRSISKYKNTKETPIFKKGHMVFGIYENKRAILDKGCVYIVEGQFDVIKASEIGLTNIVALGTSHMNFYQFCVISRYSNNIFLLLDNDEAGHKGRERIIHKFGHLSNIKNFYLPDDYKDIDEYITKEKIGDWAEMSFVVKD